MKNILITGATSGIGKQIAATLSKDNDVFISGRRKLDKVNYYACDLIDMFSIENGAYPYMTTVNGLGEEVELEYPNGMISWLTSHTSDYDGTPIAGTGNITSDMKTDNIIAADGILGFFRLLFNAISDLIS